MKTMRRMLAVMAAVVLLLTFNPAAHALSVTSQFNTPLYITINPDETKPVMYAMTNGQNYTLVRAQVENLSTSGIVSGDYYVVKSGYQYHVGSFSTASSKTIGIAYYSPPYNGLILLRSENTTSPITVRVTFMP